MSAPRLILVDVLAMFFGISSWIEICGLSVEMPIMVERLPEGWRLGSYIVVISQLANIGPLIYSAARRRWSHKVLEVPTIHLTLAIACMSCLLLAMFWDFTTIISGEEHSTALFFLTFCLALVDCTSSLLYLPFMASFREIYVLSCMAGEGMTGLFPSLLGFVQGVGGNPKCEKVIIFNITDFGNKTIRKLVPFIPEPRFSVEVFFALLCLMVIFSWISFILLTKLPSIQSEKISSATEGILSNFSGFNTLANFDSTVESAASQMNNAYINQKFYSLLAIQTYICILQNGILSSIQTFSCLPYGSMAFHLTVNLTLIINPIACFIAMFLPVWTLKAVTYITLVSTAFGGYILAIALMSPTPPLIDTYAGPILIILAWVLFVAAVTYVKAVIVNIFRREGGNKALFWGGAMSQVGSTIGGVFMFIIVNYTSVFKSQSLCPN